MGIGGLGVCSSPGGFMTKHGITLLGVTPPPAGFRRGDTEADQAVIDASAARPSRSTKPSTATRRSLPTRCGYAADGTVDGAPMIGLLTDGRRVAADAHPDLLPELAGRLLVGETVHVRGAPPQWTFT